MNATAVPVMHWAYPAQQTQICGVSPMPTGAAAPTAESDVLVDAAPAPEPLRALSCRVRRICLLSSRCPLPCRRRSVASWRCVVRQDDPEWRFNASCLVKRSAACRQPTETVLAVPQIRVRPRSNSRSPEVRIEMQAARVAGAEEHRRHPMRKPTGRPECQQGDEAMQPPTRRAPWIARSVSTEFGRRHVKRVAIARLLVAIAAVTLGSIFCVSGQWWGALLFVPAALNLWFAYLMPSWKRALDAESAQP